MTNKEATAARILAKLQEKVQVEHYSDGPAPQLSGLQEAAEAIAEIIAAPASRVITKFSDFAKNNEESVPVVFVEPQEMSPEETAAIMSSDLITDQPTTAQTTGVEPGELVSDIVSDTPVDAATGDVTAIQTVPADPLNVSGLPGTIGADGMPIPAVCSPMMSPIDNPAVGTAFDPNLAPASGYYDTIAPELSLTDIAAGMAAGGIKLDGETPQPIITQSQPHWWEENDSAGATPNPMSETVDTTNYMALETLVSEHLFLQYIVSKHEAAQGDRETALRYVCKNYVAGDKELEARLKELSK